MSTTEEPVRQVAVDDLAKDWETVRLAKAKARAWTEIAESAMAKIKDRVGDADEATIAGRPVIRHSTRTVTRLDTKMLRAEIPEPVLAPYLRTTTEHRYDVIEETR